MTQHQSVDAITGYHAHVYYSDDASKARAEKLRAGIEALSIAAVLGRWHDAPIGPHPTGSYQVAFGAELFAQLIPWMALNRDGLSVLIHPNTDDPVADHSANAIWLGEQLTVDLEILRRFMAAMKPA